MHIRLGMIFINKAVRQTMPVPFSAFTVKSTLLSDTFHFIYRNILGFVNQHCISFSYLYISFQSSVRGKLYVTTKVITAA